MKDIMDLHTHTVASGHAYNTLYEMVQAAAGAGLSLFGSSDHAPGLPGCCTEMYFMNFKVLPKELFGVRLLMGSEVNILDYQGSVDLRPRILEKLDYAIASIHPPCFRCGTVSQNTAAYIKAMENPYIHIIGHPDDGRFPVDYDALAAAAARHHVLLEVNRSSLSPHSSRQGARANYQAMLERCVHYGTSVLLSSDAHAAPDAGNHREALRLLEEVRFPEDLVVNTSLEKLARFLPVLQEAL